jgi:dienelactone hydrolase
MFSFTGFLVSPREDTPPILSNTTFDHSSERRSAMKKRKIIFGMLLPTFLLLGCASTSERKEIKQLITLLTADQEELQAAFYEPPFPNVPGVILLPDTRCDKENFGSIPSRLQEAGFAVLAMDFRYKEVISRTKNREDAISTIKKQDLHLLIDYDVKAALAFMSKRKGFSPSRICLIGTSLGSRIALVAGAKYKVRALVLVSLSGREALPGGKPVKLLLDEYGGHPVLLITAQKDWGGNYTAADHNREYYEWAKGPKELRIWPGGGHGVELIEPQERLELLARWLRDNL